MFFSSVSRSISFPFSSSHYSEKFFHRHGRRTGFFNLRLDRTRNGHVQIGRGEFDAILFRAQKHVGQNRQRGARADDRFGRLAARRGFVLW